MTSTTPASEVETSRVETPAPRARRADARRNVEMIVDAAARVLAEDPRASMHQIAEAAGVHRATVHRHYATRADLVEAVRQRAFDETLVAIRASQRTEDRPREALARYVRAFLSVADRYRIWRIAPILNRTRDEDRLQAMRVLADIVARGQRVGQFRADLSTGALALTVNGLIFALLPEIAAGAATIDEGAALILRLLAAPQG